MNTYSNRRVANHLHGLIFELKERMNSRQDRPVMRTSVWRTLSVNEERTSVEAMHGWSEILRTKGKRKKAAHNIQKKCVVPLYFFLFLCIVIIPHSTPTRTRAWQWVTTNRSATAETEVRHSASEQSCKQSMKTDAFWRQRKHWSQKSQSDCAQMQARKWKGFKMKSGCRECLCRLRIRGSEAHNGMLTASLSNCAEAQKRGPQSKMQRVCSAWKHRALLSVKQRSTAECALLSRLTPKAWVAQAKLCKWMLT